MENIKANILGTEYEIIFESFGDENCDGSCDQTSKTIRIRNDNANGVENLVELQKQTLRHEIVHAYLFESGIGFNWQHPTMFGHDETIVDWFAIQSPKIFTTFSELGLL